MSSPTATDDDWLGAWLLRLQGSGFRVGTRERLLAHALLARFAVADTLPADPAAAALLLRPLLCRSAEQQKLYDELLTAWRDERALQASASRAGSRSERESQRAAGEPPAPPTGALWALLALVVVVVVVFVLARRLHAGTEPPPQPVPPVASAPVAGTATTSAPAPEAAPAAAPASRGVYVPLRTLPFEPAGPPGWAGPVRIALLLLAAASAPLLLWLAWRRWQGQLSLKAVRTDQSVDERVLHARAEQVPSATLPPAVLRPASRLLRQRTAGAREEIDLPASLRATIEAAGAFTPRTRALSQTPEYLVLVDRRGPADHLARWQRTLVDALAGSGVAISVYFFEQTPALGCWRERADGSRFDRSALAELGGRFAGQRLLVFADPAVALDPRRGTPLPWAAQVRRDFPEAAWFTPRPVTSWAGPEYALADARELGFLVLPLMAESVATLAGWFASGRAHLQLPEDLAGPWPPSLPDDPFALALRHAPPPGEAIERLLRELRQYLGLWRFQWLAACAVFPALSWPLTLALGQALLDATPPGTDDRPEPARAATAVAIGAPLLGALPWFRYGRMPDWLREALLARLTADAEAHCRLLIEQRLDLALSATPGVDELARVALRRAWLRRGQGVAQDRLLVDFLRGADRVSRLVQRVPERLRRALFRRGSVAYGLRPGWLALPAVGVLAGVFAASPSWQRALPTGGAPHLALAGEPMPALERRVESLAVSPDGLRLLLRWEAQPGRATLSWLAATDSRALVPQPALGSLEPQDALLHDEGSALVVLGSDSVLTGYSARTGERLNASTETIADAQRIVRSGDGRTLAALKNDGQVIVLSLPEGKELGAPPPSPYGTYQDLALAGDRLWLADAQGRLRAWSVSTARWVGEPLTPPPGGDARTLLAADARGEQIAVARITGEVAVLDAADGALRGYAVRGTPPATALAFGADGASLLVARGGRITRYGRAAGTPLRVIVCRGRDPALQANGVWRTLFENGTLMGSRPDPIAYTPEAAWGSGQLPDIAAGEVLHDPDNPSQLALARAALAWLQAQPAGTAPSRGWRLREVPGLLAVTAYACAEDERIDGANGPASGPNAPQAPEPAASAPPRLAAGMNFEVFECTPGDTASAALTRDAEAALRRLGAASVRRSPLPADKFESLMGRQGAPYELRVSLGRSDEAQAVQTLLADTRFAGLAPWRAVPVRQASQQYISVIVCPARWASRSVTGTPVPVPAPAPGASMAAPQAPVVGTAPANTVSPGATIVSASAFLANNPVPSSGFARRLLANGDVWFAYGLRPPRTPGSTTNVLAEMRPSVPWLVVNASAGGSGGATGGRPTLRLDEPTFTRLLGDPRLSQRFDAVLVNVGLDALVYLPDGSKGADGARYSAEAFAKIAEDLRTELRALVRARDAGVNRGVPLLLGTYDYPTPRPSDAVLLPRLQAAGIPPAEQAAFTRELIDRLAAQLNAFAADRSNFPDVYVVDTRGTLVPASAEATGESGDWINELIPTPAGYRKLAARWQLAIERAMAVSGVPAKGR